MATRPSWCAQLPHRAELDQWQVLMTKYPSLFAAGRIGELQLRNRVVMAPIDSIFRTEDGASNAEHRQYLGARAAGGVGLIMADNVAIEWPRGSVGSKSARIDQDRFIASLNEMVEEIHFWGGAIVEQINHAGRQTTLGGSQGEQLVSPSPIAWEGSGTVPRELSMQEIREFIELFCLAAGRAKKAAFDGVEIHAAHGYLLSSFLSPALNHRSDEYGGSTRNRAKLVKQIIESVKERLGVGYPVLVRFNCRDGIPGGLEPSEAAELGGLFEEAGADALDVSAGTYESPALTFPPMMSPEGCLLSDIALVKRAVTIPVIAVGRIVTPSFADNVIAQGQADFVALGRALLADPEWANKAQRGAESDIRPCIGCNHGCIHRIDQDLSMRCNVNPYLGREGLLTLLPRPKPREVVVVGAGPAGVEFALRAHERGHKVRLFEATSAIGGQLVFAQKPEFKKDLGKLVRFYESQLESAQVDVAIDTPVTEELIESLDPEALVIATGGIPSLPFDGPLDPPVVTYKDVLEGSAIPSGSALVLGGGAVGCEIAVYLARLGVEVTILEMTGVLAGTEDHSIQQFFASEFEQHGVTVQLNARAVHLDHGVVAAVRLDTGAEVAFPFQNLVFATGVRPDRRLADKIGNQRRVHLVGDCLKVATILEATDRAARLAERL